MSRRQAVYIIGAALVLGGLLRLKLSHDFAKLDFAKLQPLESPALLKKAKIQKPVVLPTPQEIDTIIGGDAKEAAETLLKVTLEEESALASVEMLLPRLDACKGGISPTILGGEEGQPKWMRFYKEYYPFGFPEKDKKHLILLRLADCVRQAQPSPTRTSAQEAILTYVKPSFSVEETFPLTVSTRTLVFCAPFYLEIRSQESEWNRLFDLLVPVLTSGKPTINQLGLIRNMFIQFCLQYPEKEQEVIKKHGSFLEPQLSEFKSLRLQGGWGLPLYCDPEFYRQLLDASAVELINMYLSRSHREVYDLTFKLLTATRQARLESFEKAKAHFEIELKDQALQYDLSHLLEGYCEPLPEDATEEERARQDWLVDFLVRSIEKMEKGQVHATTLVSSRLGRLLVSDWRDHDDFRLHTVPKPYGIKPILAALVRQARYPNETVATNAQRELERISKFDESLAEFVKEALAK